MRLEQVLNFDTFVTGVAFSDDAIEVTFLEKNDQSETVMLAKTMVIPIEDDDDRIQMYFEIQERLIEMIQWGYIELRNPPDEFVDTTENPREWAYRRMVGEGEDSVG